MPLGLTSIIKPNAAILQTLFGDKSIDESSTTSG
tara:strand:+ start:226752 stop:226853 length:102 start_codon:yes stop_codon:yes gene_type:complete